MWLGVLFGIFVFVLGFYFSLAFYFILGLLRVFLTYWTLIDSTSVFVYFTFG